MDLSNFETSPGINRERKAEELITVTPKKIHLSYIRQSWSLPDTLIYYITQKPSSSKGYEKLIQSCKYFFSKNPIIVVEQLICESNGAKLTYLNNTIEILNFTTILKKLWVTNALYIFNKKTTNYMSLIFPHLYRVDIRKLFFFNQSITFKEFMFLSQNVTEINFTYSNVKFENGSVVPLEDIIDALFNVRHFTFNSALDSSIVTKNTVKKLLENPHFSRINEFTLHYIDESFDIETFFIYLKNNQNTKFDLKFTSISKAYKNRLEAMVDEILATKNHNYKIPLFNFSGMNKNKYLKLRSLW